MKTKPPTPEAPETLAEAIVYFSDEARAHEFVANLRWPDGKQVCPKCGTIDGHYFLKTRRVWKCRACRKQFSVKVGTIFEDSPLSLSKWLPAMWLLANCKNGVSSYEVARALGVTQKTAWFMLQRLRLALQPEDGGKMHGIVEIDESYIGGKARNMHKTKRERVITGTGGIDKIGVVGFLQRGAKGRSKVIAQVSPQGRTGRDMEATIKGKVAPGAAIHTDGDGVFYYLCNTYAHTIIDHAGGKYVNGEAHTNGVENFWTLLKRTIKGTYVSVAPFHTFRYLDEQAFRFNERSATDGQRFTMALSGVKAKRLTYARLTGAGKGRRTA